MAWLLLVLALLLLVLIGYWQFIIAEGVYLGPSVVRLLYDWTAGGYDRLKGFDEVEEDYFLGLPLATALSDRACPWVLDVATGTGRLPQTLARQPGFEGRVFGLDLSARMLRVAGQHLAAQGGRAAWLVGDALCLPFADGRFDAVACMEALEFFADGEQAVDELVRVVKPGGWLLFTNRVGWEARLMPGHTWTRAELAALLRARPLADISIRPWQTYYDLVWARKRIARP